jgi:hypothetical protein
MDNLDPQMVGWIVAAVVVVALVAAVLAFTRGRRSKALRDQFGAEYHRTVDRLGSRAKAEAELADRQKRVGAFTIVPLAAADAERFTRDWKSLQSRFIDSPKGTLVEADRLVRDLMMKRGYPMGDFERRAADISVDHPALVENYRTAHDIAERSRTGAASTEDLRQAVIHYRALFDELLEVRPEAEALRRAA